MNRPWRLNNYNLALTLVLDVQVALLGCKRISNIRWLGVRFTDWLCTVISKLLTGLISKYQRQ